MLSVFPDLDMFAEEKVVQCVSTTVLEHMRQRLLGSKQMYAHLLHPCAFSVFDYIVLKVCSIFYFSKGLGTRLVSVILLLD